MATGQTTEREDDSHEWWSYGGEAERRPQSLPSMAEMRPSRLP